MKILLLLSLLLSPYVLPKAQNKDCTKIQHPIAIDAILDDCADFVSYKGFNNLWSDNSKDNTFFAYKISSEFFYFYFKTTDSTLIIPPYDKELSVANGDRVEIFFSIDKSLNNYYCLEIGLLGDVLDYKAKHYRQFNDEWDYKTLKIATNNENNNFIVEGKISMSELKSLGLEGEIFMGAFRADYLNPDTIDWYTKTIPPSKKLDFHFPEVFEKISL
ncbi:hypothetical protein E9993_15840 [Labilibacter sediminis]|nr:hypothetical protein E9993_15840 [Labilibacter sediminis]